jgi:dihydroxyacetone kinase-like predicted kinase
MNGNNSFPTTEGDKALAAAIAQQKREAAHAAKVAALVSLDEMKELVDIDLINVSERLNEVVRSVFMFVSRRDDETMNAIAPEDAKEEELQAIEDKITLEWNKLEEATPERWVIIATQHLQQGLMALRRAVDAPTDF